MTSNISRPFQYTNRDFDSLLVDVRRRMQAAIPEWTTYDAGFESILLEVFCYVGDIENFYIDRSANEAFLQNAVRRESILNIAAMLGYTPGAQTAAACTVLFTKAAGVNEDVTIPAGTALFAQTEGQAPVYFETQSALTILQASLSGSVTAVEGQTVLLESLGTSGGAQGQSFALYFANVIRDSVRVYTQNGPPDPVTGVPALVEWAYFQRIIDADFFDLAFTIFVDEDNFTYIIFGDGVSGVVPSAGVPVVATYRYGLGSRGNVGVGAVRSFYAGGTITTKIGSVTNTTAATGGTDPESMESMRLSIPRSLTTIERAVTTDDYAALALRVAGVAKAMAVATVSTSVTVYIAPAGGGQPSTNLTNQVTAYFTGPPRRYMIGTALTLAGPSYVPINITLSITVNPKSRQDTVKTAITNTITTLFSFNNRLFNELMSKAMLFREIVDTDGVLYADVTVFSRTGSGTTDVQLAVNEIATLGTLTINATGGVVLS